MRTDTFSCSMSRVSIILLCSVWGWCTFETWRSQIDIFLVWEITANPPQTQNAPLILKSNLQCVSNSSGSSEIPYFSSLPYSVSLLLKQDPPPSYDPSGSTVWVGVSYLPSPLSAFCSSVKMVSNRTFQLIQFCSTVFLPSDQL